METVLFSWLRGAAFGFSVAAPVGPIGILCIQRTMAYGRRHGFVSGLGAATADAACGCLAALGITALLSAGSSSYSLWIQGLGALYLCYLGQRIITAKPAGQEASLNRSSLLGMYRSTLLLTMLNPMTWMTFAGGYAGWGSGALNNGILASLSFVIGLFAGSALWWGILSAGIGKLRSRFPLSAFVWINRTAGGIIVLLGGYGLLEAVYSVL